MSNTNSLHYELCRKCAAFLRNRKNIHSVNGPWLWAAVELVTQAAENCDIWATNGYESLVVEVKVSRTDFLRDRKKVHFRPGMERFLTGNFRYYLAPEGIINYEDLPEGYGLLTWDGKKISVTHKARRREASNSPDLAILCSILRREGIQPQTFDYRNTSQMGMGRIAAWIPAVLKPYSKAIEALYEKLFGDFDIGAVQKDFDQGRLALSSPG